MSEAAPSLLGGDPELAGHVVHAKLDHSILLTGSCGADCSHAVGESPDPRAADRRSDRGGSPDRDAPSSAASGTSTNVTRPGLQQPDRPCPAGARRIGRDAPRSASLSCLQPLHAPARRHDHHRVPRTRGRQPSSPSSRVLTSRRRRRVASLCLRRSSSLGSSSGHMMRSASSGAMPGSAGNPRARGR